MGNTTAIEKALAGMSDKDIAQFAAFLAAKAGEGSTDAPAPFVRQYVGARYVPVFADPLEWDSGRGYEALTIVIHQGNSYTSAQPVPIGIDISNTAYWALTGNYNAQIEAYRKEVAAYDGRITALEKSPVIVVIGDSWSAVSGGYYSWTTYFVDMYPCNLYNFAKGGNGYVRDKGATFGVQLANAAASTEFSNMEVDELIIYGSINDSNGANLYETAKTVISQAKDYFPNACVRVIGEQNIKPYPDIQYANGSQQVKLAAIDNSVSFYDSTYWLYNGNNMYKPEDTYHPSERGAKQIAVNILNIIKGNEQVVSNNLSYNTAIGQYVHQMDNATIGSYIDSLGNIHARCQFAFPISATDVTTQIGYLNIPNNYMLPPVTPAFPLYDATNPTVSEPSGYVYCTTSPLSNGGYGVKIMATGKASHQSQRTCVVDLSFLMSAILSQRPS